MIKGIYSNFIKGLNKVEISNPPSSICEDDIYIGPLAPDDNSHLNQDKILNIKIETKIKEERMAAVRSLRTNLCLIFISFAPLLIFLSVNLNANIAFLCLLLSSVNKGIMTILTSIANFGTIREVMANYWIAFQRKCSFSKQG
jgi:hypothetical protein